MTGCADGFAHPVDFYFAFFNSANSAFISAISTFSFSPHSSRICAYTFRACFLPSIQRVFYNVTDLNWQALEWCHAQNNISTIAS